jgi:plastocyanin
VRDNVLRIITVAVAGLLLTGCLSSEPKVTEAEQVSAEQLAAMQATEGGGEEGGGGGGGGGSTAEFVAVDIAYDQAPTELTAGTVSATLTNEGAIEHNVVIEELDDQKILDAPAGQSDSGEVELQPGEYTYFCDVAGHREAGMEGTLTVIE